MSELSNEEKLGKCNYEVATKQLMALGYTKEFIAWEDLDQRDRTMWIAAAKAVAEQARADAAEQQEEALPTLLSDQNDIWSWLLQSSTGDYLGMQGDRRLLTLDIDLTGVVIGEAVTGNDRYPPGRFQRVHLDEASFRLAMAAFRHSHQVAAERGKLDQPGASAVDDFDPFLDADDLP